MSNLYKIILNQGLNTTKTESVMEINFYNTKNGKSDVLMSVYPGTGNHAEGAVPHMHIHINTLDSRKNTKKNPRIKDACLKLNVPEYFNHSTKTSYILTTSEMKEVEAFLDEYYSGKINVYRIWGGDEKCCYCLSFTM